MTSTFITSRQLDRAPGKAKLASLKGPVFITERGEVQSVLISEAEYQRLAGRRTKLPEALGMPGESRG